MTHPTKQSRLQIVDALRGFALAGVAIAHVLEQYIAGPTPPEFMEGVNSLPDQIISAFSQIFITGKFFALFSILFGLSFFIQMESAEKKGIDFSKRFLWRATLLFLIGLIHQLFYRGDILTIYAVIVPFLIPFYKISNKWIIIVSSIMFFGIPRFISFAIFGNENIFGSIPLMDASTEQAIAYNTAIQKGSIWEVFLLNISNGMIGKFDFQLTFFGRFYYTFGYFLIGLWLGRHAILKKVHENTAFLRKALITSAICYIIFIATTGFIFSTFSQPVDFSQWQHIIGINFYGWSNLALTSVILCSFVLLYKRNFWAKRFNYFAVYGRMALTNYVFQAIIGTAILFGWGFGYLGQLRTGYLFLIALGIIAFQRWFSKIWLSYLNYGPLEWLWRSGTYLKWQPLVKNPTTPIETKHKEPELSQH